MLSKVKTISMLELAGIVREGELILIVLPFVVFETPTEGSPSISSDFSY